MKIKPLLLIVIGFAAFAAGEAPAQTTTFTYQGRLTDGAVAASGTYQMEFRLYDALTAGAQIGSTITNNSVTVTNGSFKVDLDFAAGPFTVGANRWLEISVRKTADPPGFTTLSPRQQITSSPYAIRTENVSGIVAIANGGTGSATQNFVDLSTTQNVAGSKTFTNGLSVTGNVVVSGGIDFSSRVVKTSAMTGTTFANSTLSGTNVCPADHHVMTAWEAMVIDMLAPTAVFDVQGWVIGSFPNVDINLRSLVNGQDSLICPVGSYPTKYPSNFAHGTTTYRGGLHCAPAASSFPVWCARNRGM